MAFSLVVPNEHIFFKLKKNSFQPTTEDVCWTLEASEKISQELKILILVTGKDAEVCKKICFFFSLSFWHALLPIPSPR